MNTLPLAGRRILVTRAAHQAGKLSEGLRALGAEPVEVPVLEIVPPESYGPLDRALRSLHSYDWLIVTSANTVRALADRAAALGFHLTNTARLNIATIGDATAEAARHAGLSVTLVPDSYVAESLVAKILQHAHEVSGHETEAPGATLSRKHEVSGHETEAPGATLSRKREVSGHETEAPGATLSRKHEVSGHETEAPDATLPRKHEVSGHDFSRAKQYDNKTGALVPEGSLRGNRVLIARAAIARDVIPDALRAAGATVDVVDAYRNVMPASAPALLREALKKGIAAAAFTSSSSVTHLADAAHAAGIEFPFAGVAAISIGPITTKTLRDLGWEPAAEATPSDVPGLVQAVLQALQ